MVMEKTDFMDASGKEQNKALVPEGHEEIFGKLSELYQELFQHNGYGTLRVEMRFLKKGQKEIFLISGKEFRFVVDYPAHDRETATQLSGRTNRLSALHANEKTSTKEVV